MHPLDGQSPASLELGDGHWFDEPIADERSSWVMPAGHGTYLGLDLELLDPADEDQLTLLIEAQHPEMADALAAGDEILGDDDEPINPRLHVGMHLIVANQLLVDDPVESWQTVRRLARLGYDWHDNHAHDRRLGQQRHSHRDDTAGAVRRRRLCSTLERTSR